MQMTRGPRFDQIVGITNDQFIATAYGARDSRAECVWVASFRGHPQGGAESRWGGWAYDRANPLPEDANNFVAINTVCVGSRSRSNETFHSLYWVLLDDVGTKVEQDAVEQLLAPSWRLETSTGNFQYGYRLTERLQDGQRAARLIEGLAAAGYTDPGATGKIRYARLPVGVNGKTGFKVKLRTWDPDRTYTVDAIARAFGITMEGRRGRRRVDAAVPPGLDPYLKRLTELGLLKERISSDGWHDMTCPWIDEHTDAADNGTAYKPGGFFRCHHGHCANRRFLDLRAWLESQHGAQVQELDAAMPGLRGRVLQAAAQYVYAGQQTAFFDRATGKLFDKEAVSDMHLHATEGENMARLLLESEALVKVHSLAYEPAQPLIIEREGAMLVNTWRAGPVEPASITTKAQERRMRDAVRPWLDHLDWIYPESAYARLVQAFITHVVARRGEKINWALVQYALAQGVGRDTLLTPVARILGDSNVRYIDGEAFDNAFNYYARTELLIINELDTGEVTRFKVYNKLKPLVASPPDTIEVNEKFVPQYSIRKVLNVIINTNTPGALSLPDTDRRIAVVASPRTKKEAEARVAAGAYAELHKLYADHEWLALFAAYLSRDAVLLKDLPAKGHAPDTAAKAAMREAGDSPTKAVMRDALRAWPHPLFTVRKLRAAFASHGVDPPGPVAIANILRELGCELLCEARIGGVEERIWAKDPARYAGWDARKVTEAYRAQR
jgi:hypothetical protein